MGWPDDDEDEDPPCVGPGVECLFDLDKDPAERVDVGNSHPAVLAALRALLFDAEIDSAPSRVLETPGDPLPTRAPRRAVGELAQSVGSLH